MKTLPIVLIVALAISGCASASPSYVDACPTVPVAESINTVQCDSFNWPPPLPSLPPVQGLDRSIEAGARFLQNQFNPDLGLLRESPEEGQYRYRLANDNAIATYVLTELGENDLAEIVRTNLHSRGYQQTSSLRIAWGQVSEWPPDRFEDSVIQVLGNWECDLSDRQETGPVGDCIFQETHSPELGVIQDWSSYSRLHCMAAVNEFNRHFEGIASWLLTTELSTFDGKGFPDQAWIQSNGSYETLGLAWCVYASALLQVPVEKQMLNLLLDQQDRRTGGFYAHYQAGGRHVGDPDVETTSIAMLALMTLQKTHWPVRGAPGLGWPADYRPRP